MFETNIENVLLKQNGCFETKQDFSVFKYHETKIGTCCETKNEKTLKTFFFWMTVINFLFLTISTFGVVMLTQEMKVFHSKIFHVSSDELSQIYFEYLAWYKLLWLFLNLVPYISLRVMLSHKGNAESGT